MSQVDAGRLVTDADYLKSLTVLYVEDDPEIRLQLTQMLSRRVGRLLVEDNGETGLETYRRERPDMVVTDILMPMMDGLTMAAAIREDDSITPIIVTTAFERPDYLIRSIDVGVDKYVVKPLRRELLLAALYKCAGSLRSEILLRESEERYRTMFQSFRVGICIVDPDPSDPARMVEKGRIRECNTAFLQITGRQSATELVDRPYADLLPPEVADALTRDVEDYLFPNGVIDETEREFLRADGSRVPTLVQTILRRDVANQPSELWELVSDIADQKRANAQLRLAASVFEGSGEGIFITDRNNIVISVNRAFSKITGYRADEVLGEVENVVSGSLGHHESRDGMWASIRASGYWQGEIVSTRKGGQSFPSWLSITAIPGADGRPDHYIGIFNDVTERKQAEENIRFLGQHDVLTGLPNRILFRDRLERAFVMADRNAKQVAVLYLDLDNFKTVNDSLGHQAGDELLRSISVRLCQALRASDTVCRQGGDEFLIVLSSIDHLNDAAAVASKLLDAIAAPIQVGREELVTGASIGICIYPDDGRDAETLIRNADMAMYSVKRSGRNGYKFFTPSMHESAMRRLELEKQLRVAMQEGRLELYFQPQVNMTDGRLVGVEVLLRWSDPVLGQISPATFIPLAEETGLILQIGNWVLEQAFSHAASWLKAGLPELKIAVNVSSIQIRQQDFNRHLRDALARAGLPPTSVEIEITESALLEDSQACVRATREMSDMGITIALDDFGTGFSNMNYLQQLQVDKLKIDYSFVKELLKDGNSRSIVFAIIGLALNLGMEVIAEGVEEQAQADILLAQGCDQAQGYYFARPMPLAAFVAFLRQHAQGDRPWAPQ